MPNFGTIDDVVLSSNTNNASSSIVLPFNNQSTITVDHNKGYTPLVQVIDSTNKEITVDVEHVSDNRFVVYSNSNITGKIVYF